jgi:hypothetical protein
MWQRGAMAMLCGVMVLACGRAEDFEVTTGLAITPSYPREGLR